MSFFCKKVVDPSRRIFFVGTLGRRKRKGHQYFEWDKSYKTGRRNSFNSGNHSSLDWTKFLKVLTLDPLMIQVLTLDPLRIQVFTLDPLMIQI